MPNNKIKPLRLAVTDINSRGFNMAEFSENRVINNSEEFLIANAIREGRRRRLNMQMALNHLVAQRRRVMNACFVVLYFVATKQHHSSISLLSSVNQKHCVVGECLEQLFGSKIQENTSDFSVNVQIHIKSHCPISC